MTRTKTINWKVFFDDFFATNGAVILALLFWKINPLKDTFLLVFLSVLLPTTLFKAYLASTQQLSKGRRWLLVLVPLAFAFVFAI